MNFTILALLGPSPLTRLSPAGLPVINTVEDIRYDISITCSKILMKSKSESKFILETKSKIVYKVKLKLKEKLKEIENCN